MTAAQRVLVVDGLAETEEVLRAVLGPRGLEVDRIRGSRVGESATNPRPSVVVVHIDDSSPELHERWQNMPRVLIGPARLSECRGAEEEQYLAKPFQYGELIGAIERLLAAANR